MSVNNDRLKSWQQQLNQIIKELDALSPAQSVVDVEMLKQLNDISGTCAGQVAESIEQEKGLGLDGFSGFHRSISESINDTLSSIVESLEILRMKIADILELKTTLEEVSYSIKNVSLLMKIKTTKMGKSEFDHVVKGLESLAGQIKENTEGINISALEANENIAQTREEIDERLDRFNRLFKPSRAQMDELQNTIGEMVADTLKRCKRMETVAGQVDQVIDGICSAVEEKLLFVDRMQEVRSVLHNSVSALFEESSRNNTIQTVIDNLVGQIDQVGEWEHELGSVEQGISKDLIRLQEMVAEQDASARFLKETFSGIRIKISDFETDFNHISSTFTFSKERTREVLEAIAAINDNVSNVSRQVSQLDIGRTDLEALTYNAVFKAAKVGMQGKVMESITDEITGLSREMQSKVTDKEAVIKSILSISKEFKSSLSEKLNQQLHFSNEMNLKIREECQKLYDEIELITVLPEKTERLGDIIRQSIEVGSNDSRIAGLMQKVQMGLADILHDMQQTL